MISTTLNIHKEVLSKIGDAAVKLGKSRSRIIVLLLMRLMNDLDSFKFGFKTVTYQRDDDKEMWHCFHIKFKEYENEWFVDLRKLCKFSVSCLVGIAVKKYLNDMIGDTEKKAGDNYTLPPVYVMHGEEIEGVLTFSFFWGLPENHLKTIIPVET